MKTLVKKTMLKSKNGENLLSKSFRTSKIFFASKSATILSSKTATNPAERKVDDLSDPMQKLSLYFAALRADDEVSQVIQDLFSTTRKGF